MSFRVIESRAWLSDGEKALVFIGVLTGVGEALRSDLITHWRTPIEPPKPTNLIDSFIADGGFDQAMGCKNGSR